MKTLKVISALMCYPQSELVAALPELKAVLVAEGVLPGRSREALEDLIDALGSEDLYALQERYVNLFDRGRALSLHIFEHVHGESRDRGQAMVDLIELYKRHGFELAARELPDYVPLFLEFLAERPLDEVRELLGEAMPVLALLGARLAERGSPYAVLFEALTAIGGHPDNHAEIREQARTEGPDQTLVNMDKIWEEEQVTFLANQQGGCGGGTGVQAQPVRWVGRGASASQTHSTL